MTDTVSITSRAASRIKDIVAAEPGATALRVAVEGGGCSGFQYDFKLDSQRADDDLVIERDGATVLIDSVSLVYMGGSEIDFVDDLIGQSFKVNNPQATMSCGCGTSFSI
ncbi:iron-sulfur cluster insertion protein ErpA [Taklimakanibacter deserti]|uniref:iron-sulfur cluster insertion protein ErpA n=1 Tax=Taklimakanibacter deserti TaxID=2267839 RepID=UPI000E64CF0D